MRDKPDAIVLPLTFEERMRAKRQDEVEQEKVEAEKLRTDYLKRTGRTEMKP
jgi:uncharacterized protein YnzC (UPF0291/DUF896 family)